MNTIFKNALVEITDPKHIHKYTPLSIEDIRTAANKAAMTAPVGVKMSLFNDFREFANHYYSVDRSTVLFIPASIPSTKSVVRANADRKAKIEHSFLVNCVNFTYSNVPSDGKGKQHPRVLVGVIGKNYQNLSAADKRGLSGDLMQWLHFHPEVTNVMVADTTIALKLFPRYVSTNGTSMKSMFMQRYSFDLSGVSRRVTVTPNPTQLFNNEEQAYALVSEIYRFMKNWKEPIKVEGVELKTVDELRRAIRLIKASNKKGSPTEIGIDLETTGLIPNYHDQHILSCAFSDGTPDKTYKFLVDHPDSTKEDRVVGLAMLTKLISDRHLKYIFQNGKYDLRWMKYSVGKYPAGEMADTLLIDHYLNETFGSLGKKLKLGIMGMDAQIPRYLHYQSHKVAIQNELNKVPVRNPYKFPAAKTLTTMREVRDLVKMVNANMIEPNSGQYGNLPVKTLLSYNADDAYATINIYREMMRMVEDENNREIPKVITHLHHRQMVVAAEMEGNGFPIDYRKVLRGVAQCDEIIEDTTNKISEAGITFNPSSNKQTIEYLLGKGHDLSPIKNHDTGEYMLDSEHLMHLASKEPWIPHFITMKKAMKARNTYFIPFIQHSYKGTVYFSLNLHGTATGRLSSNNPNFQNIPKKIYAGKHVIDVKSVLWSGDNSRALFDADLSSAEVKVLTVYVKDKHLIARIKAGDDLHCYAASVVNRDVDYHKAEAAKKKSDAGKEVSAEERKLLQMRNEAKSATFGTIYGMGAGGLANQLYFDDSVTRKSRVEYARTLLEKLKTKAYPALNEYLETVVTQIESKGKATTVFGRNRRFERTLIKVTYDFLSSYIAIMPSHLSHYLFLNREKFYRDNRPIRQFLNALVQSTTSDYFQDMIYELLVHGERVGVKLFVTVHDSVVGTIPNKKGEGKAFFALFDNIVNKMPVKRYPELPVKIGLSNDFSLYYGSKSDTLEL